jgi:hypothetical protein
MKQIKVRGEILSSIGHNCKGDEIMRRFLTDLCFLEVQNVGQWWWKDKYNEIIENYLKDWEGYYENKES